MRYREERKDLFSISDNYFLAHCISADFAFGRGIAVEFNKRFNMKNALHRSNPQYLKNYINGRAGGDCIRMGRVLNLVTKEYYYQKPTPGTMWAALRKMKAICLRDDIRKVAMPMIGSGRDGMKWDDVSATAFVDFSYRKKEKNHEVGILRYLQGKGEHNVYQASCQCQW